MDEQNQTQEIKPENPHELFDIFSTQLLTNYADIIAPDRANIFSFFAKTHPAKSFSRPPVKPKSQFLVFKFDHTSDLSAVDQIQGLIEGYEVKRLDVITVFSQDPLPFQEEQISEAFKAFPKLCMFVLGTPANGDYEIIGKNKHKTSIKKMLRTQNEKQKNGISSATLIESKIKEAKENIDYESAVSKISPSIAFLTPLLLLTCAYFGFSSMLLALNTNYSSFIASNFGFSASHFQDTNFWERLFLSQVNHYGGLHFSCNILALYWIGIQTERLFGPLRFIVICFASAAFTSIFSALLGFQFNGIVVSAGISGVISGLIGARLAVWTLRRNLKRSILERSEEKDVLHAILMTAIVGLSFSGIDNFGHLGGLVGGGLSGLLLSLNINDRKPMIRYLKHQILIFVIPIICLFALLETKLFVEKNETLNAFHFANAVSKAEDLDLENYDRWVSLLRDLYLNSNVDAAELRATHAGVKALQISIKDWNYRSKRFDNLKTEWVETIDDGYEISFSAAYPGNETIPLDRIPAFLQKNANTVEAFNEIMTDANDTLESLQSSKSLITRIGSAIWGLLDRYR